jgi:hypothetical protein
MAIQSTGLLAVGALSGGFQPATFVSGAGIFLYSNVPGSPGSSSTMAYVALTPGGGLLLQSTEISSGGFAGYYFLTNLSATGLTMEFTNGVLTPNTLSISSTQIEISNSSGPSVTITASEVAINQGTLVLVDNGITTTINNASRFGFPLGISVDDGTYSATVTSTFVELFTDTGNPMAQLSVQGGPVGNLRLWDASANNFILSPFTTSSGIAGGGSLTIPNAKKFLEVVYNTTTFYIPLC